MTNSNERERIEAGADKTRPFELIKSLEAIPNNSLKGLGVRKRRVSPPRNLGPDTSGKSRDRRTLGSLGPVAALAGSALISLLGLAAIIIIL